MKTSSSVPGAWLRCFGVLAFLLLSGAARAHAGSDCSIDGPRTVLEGESFTLCAPSTDGVSFHWSGNGIVGATDERCIHVGGRSAGTYEFVLRIRSNDDDDGDDDGEDGDDDGDCNHGKDCKDGKHGKDCPAGDGGKDGKGGKGKGKGKGKHGSDREDCVIRVVVTERDGGGGEEACQITGPSSVDVDEDFTLCGPEGDVDLRWEGFGVAAGTDERCLDVGGLAAGRYFFILHVTRGGTTTTCFREIHVGDAEEICGSVEPLVARVGDEFELCGPDATGLLYEWSGPNVPLGSDDRCVEIVAEDDGWARFTLEIREGDEDFVCEQLVRIVDGECAFVGPTRVDVGEDFTLCGPIGTGLSWEWEGTGIAAGTDDRCVTLTDLSEGEHVFTLTIHEDGNETACEIRVVVGSDDDGGCDGHGSPRPLAFWRDVCDADGSPFSSDDFERLTDCVDERTSVFECGGEVSRLCSVLDDGGSLRNRIRRQYAALLANVCAWDLELRDDTGARIGLSASASLSCRGGIKTVDDLIDKVERLLSKHSKHGWYARACKVTQCLIAANRGEGACCRDKEDGDGQALVRDMMAAAQGENAVELGRPSPNPFSTSTRMQYAIDEEGTAVDIGLYDIAGRLVQKLANGVQAVGIHEVSWNGTDQGGHRMQPGVYFVRGRIGSEPVSARVMLLK